MVSRSNNLWNDSCICVVFKENSLWNMIEILFMMYLYKDIIIYLYKNIIIYLYKDIIICLFIYRYNYLFI